MPVTIGQLASSRPLAGYRPSAANTNLSLAGARPARRARSKSPSRRARVHCPVRIAFGTSPPRSHATSRDPGGRMQITGQQPQELATAPSSTSSRGSLTTSPTSAISAAPMTAAKALSASRWQPLSMNWFRKRVRYGTGCRPIRDPGLGCSREFLHALPMPRRSHRESAGRRRHARTRWRVTAGESRMLQLPGHFPVMTVPAFRASLRHLPPASRSALVR